MAGGTTMSDEKHISRRASLRGIAATGVLLGGTGLGVGTASAGEESADSIKNIKFEDCHSLAVQLEDDHDELTIRIRTYNERLNRIENIEQTVSADHVLPYEVWKGTYDEKHDREYDQTKKDYDEKNAWLCDEDEHEPKHDYDDNYDGKHVWPFSLYQFYDRSIDSEDKLLSVTVNGDRFKNPNCGKKHRQDYDKKGEVDPDELRLVAICVNSKKNTARFRVDNANKKKATVQYDVFGTDRDGELTVEPKSATFFDVEASGSGGQATVRLFYEGEEIDVKASNTQKKCAPEILVTSHRSDLTKGKARFIVSDRSDGDRTFNYYVTETGEAGTVTISDSVSNKESFWVTAPKGHASVKLYYEGQVVGTATSDVDLSGPVINKTQGTSDETIQEAIDDADEDDTIVVCEDEDLGREQATIDVEGLTLEGVDKPTIRLAHDEQNPGYPVFNVVADDVTIDGFDIERVLSGTNDGGERAGQGIKIGGFRAEGGDNATILDNKIRLIDEQDHDDDHDDDCDDHDDDCDDETDNNIMFGVAVIEPDDEDADPIDTATIAGNTIKHFDVEPYDGSIEDAGIAIFDGQEEVVIKKNTLKDNECGVLYLEDLEDNIEKDGNEFEDNHDDICPIDS